MVATQNPMDLDYRALSNAGLWFIGRLQTDADPARVIDGLEGALGRGGRGLGCDVDAPGSALVRRAERAREEPADLGATAICDESHARAHDALGDQSRAWGEGCGGAAGCGGGWRGGRPLGGSGGERAESG